MIVPQAMSNPTLDQLDRILDKLVRDTTASVHALYMGQVQADTQRARTDVGRNEARHALAELLGVADAGTKPAPPTRASQIMPMPGAPASAVTGESQLVGGGKITQGEADAIRKCIMAWLPMGAPTSTAPDSRCIAAGRELVPTWAERELAREAMKKLAP